MGLMIAFVIMWVIILLFNTFYSFLPSNIQSIKYIKIGAMIAACIILIMGIRQAVQEYQNYRFVDVSAKDGKILKNKNFKWEITKTITEQGNTVFIINERYGDASEVSIKPKKPTNKFSIYNAIDGIAIKFLCNDNEIPDFRIVISK